MNNIKAMTELRLKNINSNTINAIEDNMPPNKPSKVLLGLIFCNKGVLPYLEPI